MRLFIRLQNGVPFEHPILEDNFRQAFPDVDLNNLPDWVEPFQRVESPSVGRYEINEGVIYEKIDGVFTDVWRIRQMTDTEKQAAILEESRLMAEFYKRNSKIEVTRV
jgi:hypothetical protein